MTQADKTLARMMARESRPWRRILPVAFILGSLAALVVMPVWTRYRTEAIRREITEVVEPASIVADELQTILSTELSLLISYQVTEQQHFVSMYREAALQEQRAVQRLRSTAPQIGGEVPEDLRNLELTIDRWHAAVAQAELITRPLPSPVFLSRLFEKRPLYDKAQVAARDLENALHAEIQAQRGAISRAEGTNVLISTILTFLALLSASMVAWLGHQMRTLAREAERRRREAKMEAETATTARAEAEAAQARATFLSEASRELTSSLDAQAILQRLARLAVPQLADFCLVDSVEAEGEIVRTAAAHRNPSKDHLLQLENSRPPYASSPQFQQAITERKTIYVPNYSENELSLAATSTNEPATELLTPRTALIVPLVSPRGGVTGAVTFVGEGSRHEYSREEIELAEGLAQRVSLAADNARLYGESQQALRSREQILAIVSHDLRSPLTTISMTASLLLQEPPSLEELPEHLEVIRISARRMTHLIEDLLDVTRIDSGHRLPIDAKPCPLEPLVEEVMEIFQPQAENRGVSLSSKVPAEPVVLQADRDRLVQAVSNLIGNALKFTPRGGRVELEVTTVDSHAQFAVRDTGMGIAEENLSRIFDPYWQMNRTAREGAGLGLAIARGIIDSHGGKMWVNSAEGEGASFYFTVPLVTQPGRSEA